MNKNFFEEIADASAKLADKVVEKTGELVGKGKKQINKMSLENDLSKAQKQLGVLVYTMYKTDEKNEELILDYIKKIEDIEIAIENCEEEEEEVIIEMKDETIKVNACPSCNKELAQDAKFCPDCGGAVTE